MANKLTPKQKAFIEAYAGNATEAAIKAGYAKKTARSQGAENLTKHYIVEAIKAREKIASKARIASREQRQAFWTSVMTAENGEMKDRLKASELLGRSEGDFHDRVLATLDGNVSINAPGLTVVFDAEQRHEEHK